MFDSGKQTQTEVLVKGKGRWRYVNEIYANMEERSGTMYGALKRQGLLEAKDHTITVTFCHR